jgi:hypothetical protein
LSLVAPVVALLVVWLPPLKQFSVPATRVTDSVVDAARRLPADSVLSEARSFSLLPISNRGPALELAVATDILAGRLALPGVPAGNIHLPFDPGALEQAPAGLRLALASYAVPDFLLAAYSATGREEFFDAARASILAADAYERRAWMPTGLWWNDHAIAARVRVLGEFWRVYRARLDYRPETGRRMLEQAERYGYYLADPRNFTFATNHGIMQNLGLLQLCVAFPSLPECARFEQLALDRLGGQLEFLLDPNGILRENSAGYQAFDLELLGMTFRSLTLLGRPVPRDWADRYALGLDFLAELRRPDGTLPATGDTDGAPAAGFPRMTEVDTAGRATPLRAVGDWTRPPSLGLFPAAGYWVEWEGLSEWPDSSALRQSVMSWTYPPPPGHKHADDLGVNLWSDGTSWLTGVGYWPYDAAGRDTAESWSGSNAPHLAGETLGSARTPRLLGFGRTEQFSAVDVERRGPGSYLARRQLVRIKPNLWVIVDQMRSDPGPGHASLWTTAPGVSLRPGAEAGSYLLEPAAGRPMAGLYFLGSPGIRFSVVRGSDAPWGGWQVIGAEPRPASAVAVDQPAGSAWLTVVLERNAAAGAAPQMIGPPDADRWTLRLPGGGSARELSRHGDQIVLREGEGSAARVDTLDLTPAPGYTAQSDSTAAAFGRMSALYPRFQELRSRRVKVTGLLLTLLVGQELVLLLVRARRPGAEFPLRLAAIGAWCGLAAWLHFSFLWSWAVVAPNIAASFPVTRLRTRWSARFSNVVVLAFPNLWNAS